jgi:hypothetical protein
VHANRTYLPTYQSIDLPNLLTCLQNRTSRLCYFWGSVLWCGQKWLYYPWGDLARFGYKLNVKIVYRKQNPTGLSFGYLLESRIEFWRFLVNFWSISGYWKKSKKALNFSVFKFFIWNFGYLINSQ